MILILNNNNNNKSLSGINLSLPLYERNIKENGYIIELKRWGITQGFITRKDNSTAYMYEDYVKAKKM